MPKEDYYHDGEVDFPTLDVLFENAETGIKKVERETSNIAIPAVNQLRYAGHHLIRYHKDNSKVDELRKFANHCKRAVFDAYESGILYNLDLFKKFKEDYNKYVVSQVLPEWVEMQKRVYEIEEFTIKYGRTDLDDMSAHDSDEDDPDDNPQVQNYKKCEVFFDEIRDIKKTLDFARDDLNNVIRKEQKWWAITIIGLILASLTFFGVDSYWKTHSSDNQISTPPVIKSK